MDTNTLGIGAAIGAFFIWYWNDQKKVMKRKRVQPGPVTMPDLHTESFAEDTSPMMHNAHSANMLGPYKVEVIEENDAFFVPAETGGSVKEETMSLREYSTGRSPRHKELLTRGKIQTSAIPWVQARSHVAAEDFLKKEGLIPSNVETEVNKNYFQLWPNPFQHPYQQ
jgi:hypothetical protein